MIDPAVFLGEPLSFGKVCKVYPPKVRDVVANLETQSYIMILCWNQDDINDILKSKNIVLDDNKQLEPFDFLMANALNNLEFKNNITNAIKFFTHEEEVHVLPSQMLIYIGTLEDLPKAKSLEELRCITKQNYLDFQNIIRSTLGFEIEEPDPPDLNPIVKRVRKAARERIRAKRKAQGKKGVDYTSMMSAVCCMQVGVSPLTIGDIPYAAMNELISSYQRKEKYETDIQSVYAGADPKKVKPKYWIRPDDNGIQVPLSGISGSKKQ